MSEPSSPAYLSPHNEQTRGDDAIAFIERFCRITEDSVAGSAGELLVLRPWQRALINGLLAERDDGKLQHRQALIGLPRKNGKSSIGAALALWALTCGPTGAKVFGCACDKEQARIVFGTAKRMVELDPALSQAIRIRRDSLEYEANGSIYRVLSSEAPRQEGLSPTWVIFDEVHTQPNRELWSVMEQASGARSEPLMVGITTAGLKTDTSGDDSLCYGLYQHGQRVCTGEIDDPTFFFAWYEADKDADYRDPATWAQANPGFGDILSKEDFASVVNRAHESEFRTKKLNQWVNTLHAWLPSGTWQAVQDSKTITDHADVVLGYDGSLGRTDRSDATALVVVSIEGIPHIDVVKVWERPANVTDWAVDTLDVEQTIRDACARWQVRELVADPSFSQHSLQLLANEKIPVVAFPQTAQRMNPATQSFYECVTTQRITQSGHPALARHVGNAVLKSDERGSRLSKDHRHSNRKIDLAVASVMALDRAFALLKRRAPVVWDLNQLLADRAKATTN